MKNSAIKMKMKQLLRILLIATLVMTAEAFSRYETWKNMTWTEKSIMIIFVIPAPFVFYSVGDGCLAEKGPAVKLAVVFGYLLMSSGTLCAVLCYFYGF